MDFEKWLESDNVIQDGSYYMTQCSQYRKKFTLEEIKEYFRKEYLN